VVRGSGEVACAAMGGGGRGPPAAAMVPVCVCVCVCVCVRNIEVNKSLCTICRPIRGNEHKSWYEQFAQAWPHQFVCTVC